MKKWTFKKTWRSVNPFKYQSCHTVTRYTTKLETGGGQLMYQLKTCKKQLLYNHYSIWNNVS